MAIQGFGNAGQFAAHLGAELLGLKLVAASDSQGGVYNAEGLDAKALVDHKKQDGKPARLPRGARPSPTRSSWSSTSPSSSPRPWRT